MSEIVIPTGFTREQLIACAEREVAMRRNVYAKRVAEGRMKASKALDEQTTMQAIVEVLRQLPPTQGKLGGGE